MAVTLRIKNIDKLADALDLGMGSRPTIRMKLIVQGPAAAYALVWEWGRADVNPGPKTLWGTNPDGETRVLTRTAPSGFIRVNRAQYRQFIREELESEDWGGIKPKAIPGRIRKCLSRAADRCSQLIADTAPIDTGDLREAIVAVEDDDGGPSTDDSLSLRPRLTI